MKKQIRTLMAAVMLGVLSSLIATAPAQAETCDSEVGGMVCLVDDGSNGPLVFPQWIQVKVPIQSTNAGGDWFQPPGGGISQDRRLIEKDAGNGMSLWTILMVPNLTTNRPQDDNNTSVSVSGEKGGNLTAKGVFSVPVRRTAVGMDASVVKSGGQRLGKFKYDARRTVTGKVITKVQGKSGSGWKTLKKGKTVRQDTIGQTTLTKGFSKNTVNQACKGYSRCRIQVKGSISALGYQAGSASAKKGV